MARATAEAIPASSLTTTSLSLSRQGQDVSPAGELRGGGGIHPAPARRRRPRDGDAQHPSREVARKRGLGRLDALGGEQLRQLLLGRDAGRARKRRRISLVPLVLAPLFAHSLMRGSRNRRRCR